MFLLLETQCHSLCAQVDLIFTIFPPHPLEHWDCRSATPCLADIFFCFILMIEIYLHLDFSININQEFRKVPHSDFTYIHLFLTIFKIIIVCFIEKDLEGQGIQPLSPLLSSMLIFNLQCSQF